MTDNERMKADCQKNVRSNNGKIRELEELYDSLLEFKGLVGDSKGQFQAVTANKKRCLNELSNSVTNCKSAVTYVAGMDKTLNNVGNRMVEGTFTALLVAIDVKLAEYKAEIVVLEAANKAYEETIGRLEDLILGERQESAGNC